MIKLTIINILGQPNGILDLKKGFDKALKNIPAVSEDLLKIALNPILRKNKQKPITNSCSKNLWSKPMLILLKTEFKILRKKPGDEAFRVSFKFPRRG